MKRTILFSQRFLLRASLFLLVALFFTSCEGSKAVVNNIDEREANEIVVYLASYGIEAEKVAAASEGAGIGGATNMFNIMVSADQMTEAMSLLNRVGLPRREGTNLLTLFAKSGLMSSDREETIRYQAGLAEELKNTIRKIDGVIDADVQISFPTAEATGLPGQQEQKITAAVYVKHQGVYDDPNNHLESKIKRLLSGSIPNLPYDNVSVISDRARIADITLAGDKEMISGKETKGQYVRVWSIIMNRDSVGRFRTIFIIFIILILGFAASVGYLVYKSYPDLIKLGKKKETKEPPPEEGPPPGGV